MDFDDRVETLLRQPCWLIDIFPVQVKEEFREKYFDAEEYFVRNRMESFAYKITNVILKLRCYFSITCCFNGKWHEHDSSCEIAEWIQASLTSGDDSLNMLLSDENTLITVSDDLYVAVYNPDENVKRMLSVLVKSEGLFFREPESEKC